MNTTTGKLIKEARKKTGMTQAALARKLNISIQAVSSWEREACSPKYDNLLRIATVTGVDVGELIPKDKKAQTASDRPYKVLAFNIPKELDIAILNLRKRDEYVCCSYSKLVRVLICEGLKALEV